MKNFYIFLKNSVFTLALIWVLLGVASLVQAQVYYTLSDAEFATTNDQLRRINLDGTNDVLIATGFAQTAGPLVLDAANNRLLIADIRVSQPSTGTTNTKIKAVSLAPGNAISTLVIPPYISNTASMVIGGLVTNDQDPPTVTTASITAFGSNSATLGGNVTASGGVSVTERGVVYSSTNTTPAIGSGTKVQIGTDTGTFFQTVSGLTGSTTYYVRAYAINAAGTSYGAVQTFTTLAPNAAPTDIALTATSVAENQASGTTVGTLSTTDANTGQTFSYSLVTGAGSTDNASFQLVGNQLRTAAVFDFETNSSYLIRIRTTDSGSPAATYEESFTITVTNINETPTISPQTFAVNENAANGTVVGTVVAADPDAGATLSYSILSGNTSGAFTLVGNSLQVANTTALDFETTPTFSLSVRVSDGTLSATALVTVNLNNVAEGGLSISPAAPVCAGSPLNLTATATGFTPTNYTWSSTPAGFAASGASLTAFTQNAPAVNVPTTYTVTASATDGTTTAGASVTVLVNPTPTLTVVGAGANPTACGASDGNITFTSTNLPNGVYSLTYTGSGSPKPVTVANNGFLLTGLAAGTYSNFSISNSGCIGSVTAFRTLSDPAQPIANVGGSQAICSGSTVTLSATATNGTGVWSVLTGPSTASAQFNNTASPTAVFTPAGGAGTYVLRWTVSNGACTPATGDVVVTVTAAPTLTAGAGTNPSACATSTGSIAFTSTNLPNGVYSLTYTGAGSPKNVTVSGNAFSLTGLSAGTYSNFSLTRNGCVGSVATAVTLNDPAAPTLTAGAGTNPSACATATGSIAFTSTNLPDGVYSLTYTGAGSPKNVTVSGNAFSLTGLSAGTYSNFALTSNGCTGSVATAVTLSDPAAPTLTLGTTTNPTSCGSSNGSIAFTSANLPDGVYSLTYTGAGSPKNVTVSSNAFSLTGLTAGTYSNFGITNNGCTGAVPTATTLSDPAAPTLTLGGSTNPTTCGAANGSIAFTTTNLPDGPYSLTYTGSGSPKTVSIVSNTFSLTGLSAGTYSNFALTSNGCIGSVTTAVTLSDPAAPTLTAGAGTNPSACATATGSIAFTSTNLPDGVYSLTYTGAGSPKTVTVSGNAFSLTGLAAGTYSNFSISNNGCVGSAATAVTLSDPAAPTVNLTNSGPLSCTNTSVTLTATAGLSSYTFSNGASQPGGATSNTATVANTGVYQVTATDANGCTGSASTTVTSTADSPLAITAQPASASTVVIGANVTVSVSVTGTGPVTYQWYKGNLSSPVAGQINATLTLSNVQLSDAGSYFAVATGPCNSVTSTAFALTVTEPAPTNQPPTTTGIANQTATVGQAFSLDVASSFSDPNGDALTFGASGLPGGLSLSGSVISGTPSASGVSTVTVTASDPGSLSVSTSFTITVSPASVTTTAPFAITGVTTISCTPATNRINLTFTPRYAGLNGQPISFSVANELSPTTASGPYSLLLYADNPAITLKATQQGTPGEVSFSYNWLAACNGVNPPTNQAPTTTGIANQNATVGQGFSLNVAPAFSDPNGDALTFGASGLPGGLSLSGSVISGTPSASGVSTVTVTATDPVSLSVSTSFSITVNPASVATAPFVITGVTTVSCATVTANQQRISFIPQYSGINGQTITFSVVNELSPTTAPGPYTLTLYTDNPIINLRAQQGGTADVSSFGYNWLAACNANQPPTPNSPFAITAVTTVSCQPVSAGQRQITFNPQYAGQNGQPISFRVQNELNATTAPGPYTLTLYTDNPVITLKAIQSGTAGEVSFAYNWLAACFPGARRGVTEFAEPLTVTVLGNPVQDETVRLEVRGAQHQPLRLRITDTGGQVLTDQLTQGQLPVERHTIRLRTQSSGLLLLQVSTPTQSKVIKLIRQ